MLTKALVLGATGGTGTVIITELLNLQYSSEI